MIPIMHAWGRFVHLWRRRQEIPRKFLEKNWYVYGLKCTVDFPGENPDQSSAPRLAPSYDLGRA